MRLRAAVAFLAFATTTLTMTITSHAARASPTTPAVHAHHVIAFFDHHRKAARTAKGQRVLWRAIHVLNAEIRTLQAVPEECRGASAAACRWYFDGATQCEVAHEGGWTTDSNYPYAGRFQMDPDFETSDDFGRGMEARYGRASHWPPWAQIQHAYDSFLTRGWGPWPPYYKYGCSRYAGGSYT